jgi:hypothetical protein
MAPHRIEAARRHISLAPISIAYFSNALSRYRRGRSLAQIALLQPRIELFDMVWWVYFRRLEPVQPMSPI